MMDAQKLDENFLSCNICTKIYKDPCTLGCYHSFCRECLTKYTKTRRDAIAAESILCPNCNQMTKVPRPEEPVNQWSHQFKPNFITQVLLDAFTLQDSSGTAEECCFACQQLGNETSAEFFCEDCDILFCENCANVHRVIPMAVDHTVSPMEAGVATQFKKRMVICKEHNCLVEFCCKDCQKAVCHKCCIIYHRACHYVLDLDSMVPEMKRVLQDNYEEVNSHIQQTADDLQSMRSEVEDIRDHRSSLQSEIRRLSQKAMDLIRNKKNKLMDELDTLTEKQIEQIRVQIKSGEIDLQTFQQFTVFIKLILQSNSTMDMHDMYTLCQTGEITAAIKKHVKQGHRANEVLFEKQLDVDQLDEELQLGFLKFVEDESQLKDTPQLLSTVSTGATVPKRLSTVSTETTDDTQPKSLTDIEVVEIGGIETLVVTDFNNTSIKSFYTKGGQPCSTSLTLDGCPWTLTKMGHDTVAVSHLSHDSFELIKLTPDPVLVSTISTEKQYRCLAALSDTTLAAGCEFPPSIDVLDLSGRVLRSVITPSTGQQLIRDPWYICTTRLAHIVVVDGDAVYCVKQQGKVLFTRNLTEGYYACGGVTTTDTGSVIVADYWNNKIVQLTERGDYVRDLLTAKDGIVNPGGTRVYGDKIYVTDTLNGTVEIFQL